MKEIILSADPDQRFSVSLNSRRVTFRFRYNVSFDRWTFDLAIDDVPILYGRRVVTGVDLLKPFGLGIGALVARAMTPDAVPDRQGLPRRSVRLYSVTQADLDAVL